MQQIVLLPKIYGQYQNRLLSVIKSDVESLTSELDVSMDYHITHNNRIHVNITGADSEFVSNLLAKEYGTTMPFFNFEQGKKYAGQLLDIGKVGYGLYVDIGIQDNKRTDALVTLHSLRKQLEMDDSSLREIIDVHVFTDNLPIEIEIININPNDKTIDAALSDTMIKRYQEWISDDHERLIILGVTKKMIESVLRKTNHTTDIFSIEALGRFEFALQCKRTTRATGIVSSIGPYLRGVPINLFIPHEVQEKKDASS